MSLFLSGESGHSTYAPLSCAQTVEICQHLEALIRSAQHESAELKGEISRADSEIAALRTAQRGFSASASSLREDHQNLSSAVENLRGDLIRTSEKVSGLLKHVEAHGEKSNTHREAMKLMDSSHHSLRQEVSALALRIKDIQTDREVGIGGDVAKLKNATHQTASLLQATREDHERTKAGLNEERARMRQATADMGSLTEQLAKANTQTGVLEARLADTTAQLKATKAGLQESGVIISRLSDDQRALRGQVVTNQDELKRCVAITKRLSEAAEAAASKVSAQEEQLKGVRATAHGGKELLEKYGLRISATEDAQARLQSAIMGMQVHLEAAHSSLQGLRDRVRETNAIVLPNLHRDMTRPRSNAPDWRGGSATPRPQHHQAVLAAIGGAAVSGGCGPSGAKFINSSGGAAAGIGSCRAASPASFSSPPGSLQSTTASWSTRGTGSCAARDASPMSARCEG